MNGETMNRGSINPNADVSYGVDVSPSGDADFVRPTFSRLLDEVKAVAALRRNAEWARSIEDVDGEAQANVDIDERLKRLVASLERAATPITFLARVNKGRRESDAL